MCARRATVALLAAAILAGGCAAQSEVVGDEEAAVNLVDQIGQQVTGRGRALDAHAGAVLVREGDRDLYIDGLRRWPAELYGRTVEVIGTLRVKQLGPEPTVGPEGVPSHGMRGTRFVLEDATWRAVE